MWGRAPSPVQPSKARRMGATGHARKKLVCHGFTRIERISRQGIAYLRKRRFRFFLLTSAHGCSHHRIQELCAPHVEILRGFSSDLRFSLPQCLRTSESLRQCSRRCFRDLGERARPIYSVSHLLRRVSTSSWDREPLFRTSSRPRRTLSRT